MKKKSILLLAVNALLLLAFLACLIASGSMANLLTSQQAAKTFAGESGTRFSQVSAFLPAGSGFDEKSVEALRGSFDAALVAASLEAPEGGRLYADAWSGHGSVGVSGTRGSAEADVAGVGGDFFLFHPLLLRDGGYLAADDLMQDRVVLDEELAWRLFGSVDLAGLEVTIDGKPYLIAGVVSREDDFASTAAYSGEPGMFMSYKALTELTGAEINCYELVLANPISGFAAGKLSEGLSSAVPEALVVENSTRYSLGNRFKLLGEFGKRSMHKDGQSYPYWENAARYTEDWSALLLLLELILLIFPLVCAVIFGVRLIRSLRGKGRRAVRARREVWEEQAAERYRLAHPEEYVIPDVEEIVREVQEEQKQAREKEN